MDNEKFYDEEIVPALEEIGKKCMERGMSFVALAEYSPEARGETRVIQPDASLPMIMLSYCAKTGQNIDGYIIGLLRYCRENNISYDSSIVMKRMGGEMQ